MARLGLTRSLLFNKIITLPLVNKAILLKVSLAGASLSSVHGS